MAAAAAKPWMAGRLVESIALFADRVTGNRLGEYVAMQGYVRQSASPFDGFGAVVAAGSKPLPISHVLMEAAHFTVEEARERLAAFIEGGFVPETIQDLIDYLGERFLHLETRIVSGRFANFLVDTRSNQSVPAALVDPRLSHAALLADRLRAALRRQIGRDAPAEAFDSWQGMTLVLDDQPGGYGYTAVGDVGWYGKIHAIASPDREENVRIVREARARGIDLVLPRVQDGPVTNLVAGMPILVRSQSMRAADVHPGLGHDVLSEEFARRAPGRRRMGMAEAFSRLAERADFNPEAYGPVPSPVPVPASGSGPQAAAQPARLSRTRSPAVSEQGNVVFLQSFHRKFVRPRDEEMDEDASLGFGGLGGLHGERDLVVRRDADGRLYVFDRDLSEEVPLSPQSLPAGTYERETSEGVKEGLTEVARGGTLRHFALDGSVVSLRRNAAPEAASPAPAEPELFLPAPGPRRALNL